MPRLRILIFLMGAFLNLSFSVASTFSGDGQLRFFNYHLNEWKEIQFRSQGQLVPEGVAAIEQLLRSRDDASQIKIDVRLLDWIDHIQDHFNVDTVEIISGYRRKELNENLLKTGHNVSPVSLHVEGRAMDIHLDEIREETLRDYAKSLKQGGVGYYKNLDFVHIDTGESRYWEEAMGDRKLVGVLNTDPNVVRLTSTQNDYSSQDVAQGKIVFKWSHWTSRATLFYRDFVQNLRLERFWRGQWVPCRGGVEMVKMKEPFENEFATDVVVTPRTLHCEGPQNYFGKYRVRFELQFQPTVPFSSNEFYLKRE